MSVWIRPICTQEASTLGSHSSLLMRENKFVSGEVLLSWFISVSEVWRKGRIYNFLESGFLNPEPNEETVEIENIFIITETHWKSRHCWNKTKHASNFQLSSFEMKHAEPQCACLQYIIHVDTDRVWDFTKMQEDYCHLKICPSTATVGRHRRMSQSSSNRSNSLSS